MLPALVNGRIEYSPDMTPNYDLLTEAEYICDPGFRLVGDSTRVCRDAGSEIGEFDGVAAVCEGNTIYCTCIPASLEIINSLSVLLGQLIEMHFVSLCTYIYTIHYIYMYNI